MRNPEAFIYEHGEELFVPDNHSVEQEEDSRPVIKVKGGGLSNEATQAEEALIEAKVPLYQRGQSLVRPVIQEVEASDNRTTKVAQLVPVSQPHLIDQLCQIAGWEKFDSRSGEWRRINPPPAVASTLLSRYGSWQFSVVAGVITTPTLRPDGSVLSEPGYDAATRLILMAPPTMPSIPEKPTRADALAALFLLNGLLNEFPFVDDASRSVGISCLITPVVRGAFSVTPMHAIRASTPGTGKSFMLDVSAAIAIGQPCPVMAAGRNEEETEKRLGAALLASQPIISIDNVNGTLGGDALCQIIERPIVEIRILGKSERVRIEARSTVFATGNNLSLLGDMTRRVLLGTLDANMERPELRQFNRNPVTEVLADRGKYIAAAMTIIRAYLIAGRPNPAPRLASFEGWSDMVRSALIWLDCADPCATMEKAREEDPYLQAMTAVFVEVREVFGTSNPKTAAEIVQMALEKDVADTAYKHPALREALMNACGGKSGFLTPRELGKWLSRHKGRIVNGLRLDSKADEHGHAATWWMTTVSGSSG